ncbi:MAG: flavin reductase [Bacilli bacterium]|nr:flavin reductase [Bacilli bacterium]
MKKITAKPRPILTPQLVQMLATYNPDGTVDVMNAAWGGQLDADVIILSLSADHKTVENLRRTGCFTLGIPSSKDVIDADFVGLVSANDDPKKFEKTDWHASKSAVIDAPVIDEIPMTFECKVLRYIDEDELGFYVIARVVDILFNEDILNDKGQPDVNRMDLLLFSPIDASYRKMSDIVAPAFRCGAAKKGK